MVGYTYSLHSVQCCLSWTFNSCGSGYLTLLHCVQTPLSCCTALCRTGVALGLKLVLVGAVQLLVEVQKYTATAASNHDLIILGQEVEAIGENALSVIYNQKKTFAEMRTLGDSTRDDLKSTTTAIVAAAGEWGRGTGPVLRKGTRSVHVWSAQGASKGFALDGCKHSKRTRPLVSYRQ